MTDEREREIEARADFAGRNYSRLGSSWAEFYGRDIPYLLAQLREAEDEQKAVIAENLGDYLDVVQRGLRVWIFAEAAHGALLENAQALHETCLAQDAVEGKLEAVEKAALEHDYQHARQFMDALDRILHPQEAE